jgi:hypothetical protein
MFRTNGGDNFTKQRHPTSSENNLTKRLGAASKQQI